MNITNEIKAKVFAQYYNNMYVSDGKTYCLTGERLDNIQCGEKAQLILKPLSAITDEDAIEAIKMFGCLNSLNHGSITEFSPISKMKKAINLITVFPANIYQYLQSKGYDLPHYLLGGKTLHQAGLAIY